MISKELIQVSVWELLLTVCPARNRKIKSMFWENACSCVSVLHCDNKKLIENPKELLIRPKSKTELDWIYWSHTSWMVNHGIRGVCQTVWYHGHKLAGNRAWGKRGEGRGPPRVRQWKFKKSQCLQTHKPPPPPPNTNSFRVSSRPACPYVYGEGLNHLLMSFPPLSLTITMRNSMNSDTPVLRRVQNEPRHRDACPWRDANGPPQR